MKASSAKLQEIRGMNLVCIISSLNCGGAERRLVEIADHFCSKGWNVSLVALDSSRPFFEPASSVNLIPLGLREPSPSLLGAVVKNIKRSLKIRAAVRRLEPSVVLSFMDTTNVRTLLALLGTRIPVVISERVAPGYESCSLAWRIARRLLYPLARSLVVQTEAAFCALPKRWQKKAFVVHAGVREAAVQKVEIKSCAGDKFTVGAVGRLEKQKGFDLLIEAFYRVSQRCPEWDLKIWGSGSQRTALEQQVKHLGLAGRVSFHGTEPDTDVIWRQIQIFVLSSRFEGFPNVLCEAMAHGLACVSFDCPYGPGEIIRPQIDGLLVPPEDPELLAEALQKLMLNAELRQELGTKAGEIAERFPADKTFQLWEGILAAAARGSRK